ncbi:hypothetical protein ACFLXD_04735 [Chloroflexota bacterium]
MVIKTITVLDPTAKSGAKELPIAPRVNELNDKRIGFLWNGKPNGDILLLRIKELLSARFHFTGSDWQQRIGVTVSADDATAIIEELARTSDLVVNGISD